MTDVGDLMPDIALEIPGGGTVRHAVFQGGEVRVLDAQRFPFGSIRLPDGAGLGVTNLAFKDDRLYITEGTQGVIWRVAVKTRGLPYFHQR